MTNPDVLAKRLLHRAHNRDGLPEILIGVLFLAVAGWLYAISVLPHKSFAFRTLVILYSFGFPVVCLLGPRWLKWLRRRYLVKLEGYVEHLRRPRFLQLWLMGAGGAVFLVVYLLLRPDPDAWVVAFSGVGGGFLAGFCGRMPRFYFAGGCMAALGLGLAFARLPMNTGLMILFAVQGAIELVSGGMVWRRFLRGVREAASDEC